MYHGYIGHQHNLVLNVPSDWQTVMSWCFAEMVTLGFWADISKAVEQDPVTGVSLYLDRIMFWFCNYYFPSVSAERPDRVKCSVHLYISLCSFYLPFVSILQLFCVVFSCTSVTVFCQAAKSRKASKHLRCTAGCGTATT